MRVKHMVFGGSGFIGSNLVRELLESDKNVISIDNYSIFGGTVPDHEIANENLIRFRKDLSKNDRDFESLLESTLGDNPVILWHFAANSDIQKSATDPSFDYTDTLGTSLSVTRFIKFLNVKKVVFASSSAIYGDHGGIPVSEDEIFLNPSSNYGVMKLASERVLASSCDYAQIPLQIFRFPNVIGLPLTHGVINDIYKKLKKLPSEVQLLGDGTQQKPFMHVKNLISAMISQVEEECVFDVMNLGPNDLGLTIRVVAERLRDAFSPKTELLYQQTPFGWVGDIPKYSLDVSKMLEKFPEHNISSLDSVNRVIHELGELI